MPIPLTTRINLRADLLRGAEKRYLFVQCAEKLQQPEDYWRSSGHAASKLPRRARNPAFQMRLRRVKSIETSAQSLIDYRNWQFSYSSPAKRLLIGCDTRTKQEAEDISQNGHAARPEGVAIWNDGQVTWRPWHTVRQW